MRMHRLRDRCARSADRARIGTFEQAGRPAYIGGCARSAGRARIGTLLRLRQAPPNSRLRPICGSGEDWNTSTSSVKFISRSLRSVYKPGED